ncbi:class I SAM-dependent methyltransferase [Hydrogenovibrio kuenenii]|uniref:class I SAM-dependent methyltransferase n=1 Tax=Hydrogenovibrio kuenenii TaxID=63658 RepID=UPI0004672426|nr:class I SAM-dependent methyltransferase [Hydrogenovibrio kuenenii]
MSDLSKTQEQILRHHGGDGAFARQRITETYERRHDDEFWHFWQEKVAKNYQAGDGILDMGAGIGQFVQDCAQRYPDAQVYGIEAAPYMLEEPLALPQNAEILIDDLNDPKSNIAENSLSMVMANMVVHELVQPIKMFRAAYQWLKPGGRLCIIDLVRQPLSDYLERRYPGTALWDEETTVEDLEDAFEHFLEHNRYHADDIEFMLTAGGFKVIEKSLQRNGRFVWLVVEK